MLPFQRTLPLHVGVLLVWRHGGSQELFVQGQSIAGSAASVRNSASATVQSFRHHAADSVAMRSQAAASGTELFGCLPGRKGTVAEGLYGCLYQDESFPFSDVPSYLFAMCQTDDLSKVPMSENCQCTILLGTAEDPENAESCTECTFVPGAAEESTGGFLVSFSCE
jgi:hypothetical protein